MYRDNCVCCRGETCIFVHLKESVNIGQWQWMGSFLPQNVTLVSCVVGWYLKKNKIVGLVKQFQPFIFYVIFNEILFIWGDSK